MGLLENENQRPNIYTMKDNLHRFEYLSGFLERIMLYLYTAYIRLTKGFVDA